MLKKRIIAAILMIDGLVVQSIGFKKYLPIGKIDIVVEFLEYWDVDEIVIIDIGATLNGKCVSHESIKKVSKRCFVPISAGGGIKSIEDVRRVLSNGADKVVLSNISFENPSIISDLAKEFGNQSLIICLDVKSTGVGGYSCFTNSGMVDTGKCPYEFLSMIQQRGIGEIIINSIDRDGSKSGFDIELMKGIQNISKVPVIALGGAGNFEHMVEVLIKTDISAVAVGNLFHFTEHSVAVAKAYLEKANIQVRKSYLLSYSNHVFDSLNRVVPFEFKESI